MLRAVAACSASKSTAAGSPPALVLITSVPVRCPQISNCSMAAARKVSAAHSRTFLPCERNTCDKLADGGGLPGSIHADDQDHFRGAIDFLHRAGVGGCENREDFFFQQALQLIHIFDLLAVGFLAQLLKNFVGGGGAQIGANEGRFQIIQSIAVDFLAE